MTTIARTPNLANRPGPEVRRVEPRDRRPALALMMTGRANGDDPAVRQFLAFAADHQLDLSRFFAAYQAGRPLGCALAVPGAGRTAMLFANPLIRGTPAAAITASARAAIASLDPAATRLVQSLTDPAQKAERAALADAGLTDLAELAYMQRHVETSIGAPTLRDPAGAGAITATHWSESARPRFERAILQSYEGSRDCPGLLGLRQIDDILAGHRATGVFDPGLWSVFEIDQQPVGVLLLARVPAHDAFELVYLGVSPAWRGRGLGSLLVRYGLGAVAARGGGRMHLAVDAGNAPAVKLYRALGFRANAHKSAMICALEE